MKVRIGKDELWPYYYATTELHMPEFEVSEQVWMDYLNAQINFEKAREALGIELDPQE